MQLYSVSKGDRYDPGDVGVCGICLGEVWTRHSFAPFRQVYLF